MYPILFKIGNISVYSYGTILYIDILLSLYLLHLFSKRYKIDIEKVFGSFLIVLISMYLGGKIGYLIFNDYKYTSFWKMLFDIISPFEGGLTIIGSIFFAILGLMVSSKIYKVNFLELSDLFALVAPFSVFIGRIGCLLAGCCYGKESTWGIFLHGKIRYPVQIIESLLSLLVFIYFLYTLKSKSYPGRYLLSFLLLYSMIRFIVEFFRESERVFLFFSWAQIFSILIMLVSGITILTIRRGGDINNARNKYNDQK
ncbi:MAG: prolipoprotein diacylglyceryl transferase [Candidatus Calescibacterium sp.]|nr:prolipoprotein diacylglyceryl transferase [Candidatus Calescibacterium sp.]MCX7972293.1 prolipoprotein diacylglyceryl transferase [bacterium]MDW8195103.1 prolipoprotein diacylglyceryl transferase [Candidatus Calescibacterium sp.]